MRKISMILFALLFYSVLYAGKPEKDMIDSACAKYKKIAKADISITSAETKAKNAAKKEKQAVKKYDKNDPKTGLCPDAIFSLDKMLKNYELTLVQKDERIKTGREEIVARMKGQAAMYPQIRIILKDKAVFMVRFYDATGKRYYEAKITATGRNDAPAEVMEEFTTASGGKTTRYNYAY